MDTEIPPNHLITQLLMKMNKQKEQHNIRMKRYLDNHPNQREKLNKKAKVNYYKKKLDNEDVFFDAIEDEEDKLNYIKFLKEIEKEGD